MKKLMFAAVAAAMAGAVFAEEPVTSQIVGYQGLEQSESGQWLRTATFNLVGTDADNYSIQNFVPVLPEGACDDEGQPYELSDLDAQIQTINVYGAPDKVYAYFVAGGARAVAGWYEQDQTTFQFSSELATKTFNRGEGIRYISPTVFDSDGEDGEELPTTLQTAGEVAMADMTYTLTESGYWQVANFSPLAINIQKLTPSIPEESYDDEGTPYTLGDLDAQIQTINVYGAPDRVFAYFVEGGARAVAGWYEQDQITFQFSSELADWDIASGEGFIYVSPTVFDSDGEDGEELETYLSFDVEEIKL